MIRTNRKAGYTGSTLTTMSCSLARICFTVLIFTVEVTPQPEFSFKCPSAWTDGAVENLQCVIPQAKFSAKPSGLCDTYVDSVVFRLTTADGTKSTACKVTGFDTTCDGSANADGCGCREKSGGDVIIDYNVTAVKADHEGARWVCEPQCYDAAGIPPVLSPPNTTECFNTIFATPTTMPRAGTTVAPTTTPPNTTSETETPPTSDQGCPICKKGTDCDEPDLLCLLFLLLLIPIAVVIIIVWYFFCHNGGINATKKAEGGELESLPQDQQTTNGNKPANGNGCGQRDNKAGTGHVAPNGAS